MLNTISQACQDYYNQIPPDTLRKIGCSATFSFFASVVTLPYSPNQTVNLSRPVLAAAIAVIATTIHAVTKPIFNYIFDNQSRQFNGFQALMQYVIDITLTEVLINYTTPYLINAHNFQDGNFLILTDQIMHMGVDICIRMVNFINPHAATDIRQEFQKWGIDLQANFAPIYLTV